MSALVHLASPQTKKAPVVIEPGRYPFAFPDGHKFTVTVSHDKSSSSDANKQDRVRHLIKLDSHRPHSFLDSSNVLHVISPCPPYANPSAEPDTNSLAFRTTRFAECQLLPGEGNPNTESAKANTQYIWGWINAIFTLWPQQEHVLLKTEGLVSPLVGSLIKSGLATLDPSSPPSLSTPGAKTQVDTSRLLISRAAFWQGLGSPNADFAPWILPLADSATRSALLSSNSETVADPLAAPFRPPPSAGPIYSRFIPGLNSHLTFRVASSTNSKDVDLLTAWHDTDRVNEGWRQRLSREEQLSGMQKNEQNPYTIGLIGEWDGEPWGYVEIYYSKHSNLKDFYDAGQHDRGFHALVGEERFRGPHRVRSWMGSVVHMMFLLDPSTKQCVSEPRLSNTKMVEYEMMVGGNVDKVVDFGHKRAALVMFGKERWFQLCPMGPLPEHLA